MRILKQVIEMKAIQAMYAYSMAGRAKVLAATLLFAALGLTSCGGGSPMNEDKKNLRTNGELSDKNCDPTDHDADSTFLQVISPDDPDCQTQELPDVVVKPKDEHDGDPFTATMNKALEIFHPIVADLYDAELEMYNKIDEDAINAVARKAGDRWQIEVFGGLQRVDGLTNDALTIVLCHEMGHLIGGFPVITNSRDGSMSAEGNSDYFATQACLRKMWQDEDAENARAAARAQELPEKLTEACRRKFATAADSQMCMRAMAAIKSLQTLFTNTSLTQPSPAAVARTQLQHPEFQCRIDTLIAGALCTKPWQFDRKFPKNPYDLRRVSCTRTEFGTTIYDGVRPRCWYQPKPTRINQNPQTKKPKSKKPKTEKSKRKKPKTEKSKRKKPKTEPKTKKPGKMKKKKGHKRTSRNKPQQKKTKKTTPHKRTKR